MEARYEPHLIATEAHHRSSPEPRKRPGLSALRRLGAAINARSNRVSYRNDPFFSRDGWNHDSISASAIMVDDWNDLRGENYDGVEVVLPPITREVLEQYDCAPDPFDAEDWLRDNVLDHISATTKRDLVALAPDDFDGDDDALIDNLLEDDRWTRALPEGEVAEIRGALEMARREYEEDEDALEDAIERFRGTSSYDEWRDGFEPMMNYYWPVDMAYRVSAEEAAARIEKYAGCTSLVWIESANTHGIVLTGGGMDLSWDICAAYVCCGCIPPGHLLLNLPRCSDRLGEVILNTMMPLLIEHYEWQAKRAKTEAESLREYLNKSA